IQSLIDACSSLFGGDSGWLATQQSDVVGNWLDQFAAVIAKSSEAGARISDAERALLLNVPLPMEVTTAMAHTFIDRWNRSVDYWRAGIFLSTQVPAGQNPDFLALDTMRNKYKAAVDAIDRTAAEGYEDVLHA